MDPSLVLAQVSDQPFQIPNLVDLSSSGSVRIKLSFSKAAPASVLVDPKDFGLANRLKAQNKTHRLYDRYKSRANPYESLSKSPFINRAAMKLAGIDANLNLTGAYTVVTEFLPGEFSFCDIAGGPGSWTQYCQFRRPESIGFGITLRGPLDWDSNLMQISGLEPRNRPKFYSFYGPDNTGDLYKYADEFARFVRSQYVDGVDLAMADGGFDVQDDSSQEQESTRLILAEAYTGLMVLKLNGNLVIKLYQTATLATAGIIYLLSTCFQKLTLLKPLTSRSNSPERYLIGVGLRENISTQLAILRQAYQQYTGYLSSLVEVPEEFQQRLSQINKELLENEIRASARIAKMIKGEQVLKYQLRLDRVRAAWGISNNMGSEPRIVPDPIEEILEGQN